MTPYNYYKLWSHYGLTMDSPWTHSKLGHNQISGWSFMSEQNLPFKKGKNILKE